MLFRSPEGKTLLFMGDVTSSSGVLTSDLGVDPPEGPLGDAVQFDEDLADPARVQRQDELLFQLAHVHTGRGWEHTTQTSQKDDTLKYIVSSWAFFMLLQDSFR